MKLQLYIDTILSYQLYLFEHYHNLNAFKKIIYYYLGKK